MMKDVGEPKPQTEKRKRKLNKDQVAGFLFGISTTYIVLALTGLAGFIPILIFIPGFTWAGTKVAKKILQSDKSYAKALFWIGIVILFLIASLAQGYRQYGQLY